MEPVPIVFAFRGHVCENVHFASTLVCSETGIIEQMFPLGDSRSVFLRSSAKPFQAYPLYQSPKAIDITLEEWAIICASHAATQHQLTLVEQVLQRAGTTVTDLQCGPHLPIDEAMARQLLCSETPPSPLHNNCSGKHAGMLLACRLNGWPLKTYLDPEHPLQKAILQAIIRFSGTDNIQIAVDGCGAPVFGLPLENIARLFSALARHPELASLAEAMITHPEIVGDIHRIDTQLMQISGGNLVAKVGAEGVLGIGNRQTGQGMVIKVHDGNNAVRDRLAIAVLEDLGWLSMTEAEELWARPQFSFRRTNTQGKVVGHYEFDLAWKTPEADPASNRS
jgi:L-asparaginase II